MELKIDKVHGRHYHRIDCKATDSTYIQIKRVGKLGDSMITVAGRRFLPCPICFEKRRR